jgi:predicted nucleotidyltransferase
VPISSHFKELLKGFNGAGVRYLIVGAYAVAYYTEPRYTKDLDVWIDPAPDNARRVYAALAEFGAPLSGIAAADFSRKDMVYQVGVAPVRVDVLMGIAGLEFGPAWERRQEALFDDLPVHVICREDLIVSKEAAGRPQDRRDARKLKRKPPTAR